MRLNCGIISLISFCDVCSAVGSDDGSLEQQKQVSRVC